MPLDLIHLGHMPLISYGSILGGRAMTIENSNRGEEDMTWQNRYTVWSKERKSDNFDHRKIGRTILELY